MALIPLETVVGDEHEGSKRYRWLSCDTTVAVGGGSWTQRISFIRNEPVNYAGTVLEGGGHAAEQMTVPETPVLGYWRPLPRVEGGSGG